MRPKRVLLLYFIPPILIAACCLYPSLPADPIAPASGASIVCTISTSQLTGDAAKDVDKIKVDYDCGLKYASQAKSEYHSWVVDSQYAGAGLGTLLLAAGGAAVGIGAAGVGSASDATLATTQIGIGGGTLAGGNLWLRSRTKENIYIVGEAAIQCVSNQGQDLNLSVSRYTQIAKKVTDLEKSDISTEAPAKGSLQKLRSDAKNISDDNLKKTATDTITNAEEALKKAHDILTSDEQAGIHIVESVQSVDSVVFTAAAKDQFDVAALSNQRNLPTMPYSGNAPKVSESATKTKIRELNAGKGLGLYYSVKTKKSVKWGPEQQKELDEEQQKLDWMKDINGVIASTNALNNLTDGLPHADGPFGDKCIVDLRQAVSSLLPTATPTGTPKPGG